MNSDMTCAICLEEIDNGQDMTICQVCKKKLHYPCFKSYAEYVLRRDTVISCPSCRSVVIEVLPDHEEENSIARAYEARATSICMFFMTVIACFNLFYIVIMCWRRYRNGY